MRMSGWRPHSVSACVSLSGIFRMGIKDTMRMSGWRPHSVSACVSLSGIF
jgi:hypothetical protein